MGNVWKAAKDVVDLVHRRIDKVFPELLELKQERIVVLFHEKAREKHGVVEYGTVKKAPPKLKLLTDGTFNYEFELSLASDRWENSLDDAQRAAVVDHLLCGITPTHKESTNEVIYELRPPDVQMYTREIEHHGLWMPDAAAIEQMFAKWLGPVAKSTPTTRSVGIPPPNFAQAAAPSVKLPPKKGATAKPKPRDKDGDLEGDDLDLPFVDDGPNLTN